MMKTIPKTIRKFEVQINLLDQEEVGIYNNYTHHYANQNVHSLWRIKKVFKVYLNNKEVFTFSHFPESEIYKLRNMLPNHKLSKMVQARTPQQKFNL
ncbi:MAG: hypothetical protein D4R64_05005 [Porphyromonadaceae bacterium]|nr:MAG: hypothetical protein D4R64_05005 [Porphyromonadaceae bacterium]